MRILTPILLLLPLLGKRLPKEQVVFALNCGSKSSLRSSDGFLYQADRGFSEGTEVSLWGEDPSLNQRQIKYTEDRELYMTERWSRQNFWYDIPLTEEGSYVIILQNSENAFEEQGNRVWDVLVGDTVVLERLDVAKEAGRFASVNQYIPFTFKNGKVLLTPISRHGKTSTDAEARNSYDSRKGTLRISFKHLGKDNPMINGIILFKGQLEETDYPKIKEIHAKYNEIYAKEKLQKEFEERYLKSLSSAKLKQKRRNDREIDLDTYDRIFIEEELEKSYGWIVFLGFVAALCAALVVLMKMLKRIGDKENKGEQEEKKAAKESKNQKKNK